MMDNHTIAELTAAMESEQQMKVAARRQRDRVTQKLAAAEEALKVLQQRLEEAKVLLQDLSKYQTNSKGWQERVDQFLAADEQA